jgi:hypothetical protein
VRIRALRLWDKETAMNDPNSLMQIGVAAIVVLLILRAVFEFLSGWAKRRNGGDPVVKRLDDALREIRNIQGKLAESAVEVHWLKEIHAVVDKDGSPVWYVKSSLEDAMKVLASNIEQQTTVLRDLGYAVKTLLHGKGGADHG